MNTLSIILIILFILLAIAGVYFAYNYLVVGDSLTKEQNDFYGVSPKNQYGGFGKKFFKTFNKFIKGFKFKKNF